MPTPRAAAQPTPTCVSREMSNRDAGEARSDAPHRRIRAPCKLDPRHGGGACTVGRRWASSGLRSSSSFLRPSRSRRCCWSGGASKGATSRTVTVPRAFGASPPASRCWSGFVVFLAFESYDTSRSGARAEARIVAAPVRDGAAPAGAGATADVGRARVLRAQRRARGVAEDEVGLARVQAERLGSGAVRSLRATRRAPRPSRRRTRSTWTSDPTARTRATTAPHGGEGVIPAPVWIVLFLSAGILASCSCSSSPTPPRAWSCRRR